MNRRKFTRYLLAAGAGVAAGPAFANRGVDRLEPEPSGRAKLWLGDESVTLNYLMVLNSDMTLGIDLRKEVPQFDEDAPEMGVMFDALTRVPPRRMLAQARKVGEVYFFKRSLFVLPDAADIRPGRTSIMHRAKSYEPRPPMITVKLSGRPSAEDLRSQPLIGEAWQAKDRLILVIHPTPMDDRLSSDG